MFKLGVITDEVSQDFEEALQFAKKNQLDCVELRSAWEKGPFEYDDQDIEKIKELSDHYAIPVLAISSPLFKCDYYDEETKKHHVSCMKKLAVYANRLGAKYIRGFDFLKDDSVTLEKIRDAYKEVIDICEKQGLTLLIESEPSTNSVDCRTVGRLVDYLNTPSVRSLYEPGNDIYTATQEIPYPDGFQFVKDSFSHVHVKDAVRENGKTRGVAIGNGEVDYKGIVKELLRRNYQGAMMLETHYKPHMQMSEELLRNPKGSQISFMGDIASQECMTNLKKIIEEAEKEV